MYYLAQQRGQVWQKAAELLQSLPDLVAIGRVQQEGLREGVEATPHPLKANKELMSTRGQIIGPFSLANYRTEFVSLKCCFGDNISDTLNSGLGTHLAVAAAFGTRIGRKMLG